MLKFNLKKITTIFCLAFTMTFGISLATTMAADSKKPLIAYFSQSGHTKTIAADIQALTGGELLEIVPEKPYPDEYQKLVDLAKAQQNANERPAVKTLIENPDQYYVIFLGYPNWWSSMPMPVYTFIEQNHLNGKTIIPFCTHGGGGLGHSIEDLKKLCPDSRILKAFSIAGTRANEASSAVKSWLESLKNEIRK